MLAFKSIARNLEVVVSPDTNFNSLQERVHGILWILLHFWYFGIVGWNSILCHSSLWPQVIFSGLDLNSKSMLQPVMQALYGFESARLTSTCLNFWVFFFFKWAVVVTPTACFCQWNLTWSRWNVTVMVVAVTGLPTYLTWNLGFFESVFAISSSSPLPKHSLVFTFFSGFLNENFGTLDTCGGALTPSLDEADITGWCVLPGSGSSSGAGKEGSLSSQNISEGSHGWFDGEVSSLWYSHHRVKEFKIHHKIIDWQSALWKTCLIQDCV